MKRKSVIIYSLILLIVLGLCYYFFFFNKNKEITWRTMPIKKGKISIIVKATGTMNADTTINVGTQVTGTIWKLYADWNTVVKKGQLIAVLDTAFLHATKLDALASLAKANAVLDKTKRDFDRNKKLLDEKVVSQSDYEISLAAWESAKADVASAKAQLNHSLISLQYAVIRAPVDGVVIARSVELGQTVVSSFNSPTLFTIANDLTKMQAQANVDEADIGQCKVGQPVSFTVDAYPEEIFKGSIAQIRLQPVMVQNVVNYIVIIEVPNPDMKLKPGLTANLNIKVQEHKDILKVPANALRFTPQANIIAKLKNVPDSIKVMLKRASIQSEVDDSDISSKNKSAIIWILKGKDIEPVKVRLGLSDGNFTEVTGNLKEGDEIVLGQVSAGSSATAQAAPKSPFMPQFPSGRR
jgi:HlyD family secretion protein